MDPSQLPLSSLLSHALVAFTIEFDNEAESRLPHKTANFGSTSTTPGAPWLASLVMYENCLRYVTDAGVTIHDLHRLARTPTNLDGMRRWGYVTIDPPAGKTSKNPGPDYILRPTAAGRMSHEVIPPLFGRIEGRWRERFGGDAIHELRNALSIIVRRLDPNLPDCMPILGYSLMTKGRCAGNAEIGAVDWTDTTSLSLYTLLSKALVALALAYESKADVSLAISANVLRALDEKGVPVRDIPILTGVSKESVAMAEGWLVKQGYVAVDGKGVSRLIQLTPKGVEARNAYFTRVGKIEENWREQFGQDEIDQLRSSLERLIGASDQTSPLFQCLEPYPDNWRAKVPKPSTLPHFPMVLHRGGYPDGS